MRSVSRLVRWFLIAMALFGCVSSACAQNALVTGMVTDEHGAAVTGAKVTLKNDLNNFTQERVTDALGIYTFASVPPSDGYALTVEKDGFVTANLGQIRVKVAGSQKLVTMDLHARKEGAPVVDTRIMVEADLLLETVSTTQGGVVDSDRVRKLPLSGRDLVDLALLAPATYPVEQGSRLEGASLVVNGCRPTMNNFLLDGTDNNDYAINQSLPFQIVEAMYEFRVQSSAVTSEYGRSGGGQINIISRSGEPQFYGTLFEFGRNSALSADTALSPYNGGSFDRYAAANPAVLANQTLNALYNRRDPHVVQNQFGGNLGGHLGQRVFVFVNWESTRVSNPRPLFEHVPSPASRSAVGDASQSVASALLRLYPLPNVPAITGLTDYGANAYWVGESANWTKTDNFLERLDWRGAANSISFKHNIQGVSQIQGGTVPNSDAYPGNGIEVSGLNQNFSFNWARQMTHTTNEFRTGWSRFRLGTLALDRTVNPVTALGFAGAPNASTPGQFNYTDKGLPTVLLGQLSNYFPSLGADPNTPGSRVNYVTSFADNFTAIRGRNVVKLGVELRRIRLSAVNDGFGRGVFMMLDPTYTAPFFSSMVRVSPAFGGGFARAFKIDSYDAFFHDQLQVSPKFTFNFGVRYEVNTAPVESHNRLVNYYPQYGGLMRAGYREILDPFGNVIGTGPLPPRAGFQTDFNNWAPHMGFAWAPAGPGGRHAAVLRVGYALVFDQQPIEPALNMLLNPPYVYQGLGVFPNVSLVKAFSSGVLKMQPPYSIVARDPGTRTPYVQQFNAGIQQKLWKSGLYELGYVGSMGRKLPRLRDMSLCSTLDFPSSGTRCQAFASNPFLYTSILNQENTANSRFRSFVARFDTPRAGGLQLRVNYEYGESRDGASSLQAQAFPMSPACASFGVPCLNAYWDPTTIMSLFANYMAVNRGLTFRPVLPVITTRPRLPQDSRNLQGEWGLSDFDIRHRLVVSYIYALPGRNPLFRNFEFSGITTIQSGQPYSVFVDFLGSPLRLSAAGQVATDNRNPLQAIEPIGSHLSYTEALKLKAGNTVRNALTGPGLMNFDLAVMRNFNLTASEKVKLQFRAEFFNLLNRDNYMLPYSQAAVLYVLDPSNPASGTVLMRDNFFGQILQARPNREMQFAIKLIF